MNLAAAGGWVVVADLAADGWVVVDLAAADGWVVAVEAAAAADGWVVVDLAAAADGWVVAAAAVDGGSWPPPPITIPNSMDAGLCAIMLCGAAGSGKTTVAAFLRRHTPNITELTFAAPLKTICLRAGRLLLPPDAAASLTADHFHDPVLKATPLEVDGHERGRSGLTPRAIMQVLGTDILRDVLGPDVFIGPVLAGAARAAAAKQHIVVSDVRFANEMGTARVLAALGFRVVRLRIVRKEASVGGGGAHASEKEASSLPVDAVVPNNGTMEELEGAVLAAIAQTSPHP